MESVNYSVSSRRSGLAMKLAVFAGIYSLAVALLAGFAGGVYDWAGYGAFGLGTIPFAVATLFSPPPSTVCWPEVQRKRSMKKNS